VAQIYEEYFPELLHRNTILPFDVDWHRASVEPASRPTPALHNALRRAGSFTPLKSA
jgi:hypothetical protein